jgi:hypothetical protein
VPPGGPGPGLPGQWHSGNLNAATAAILSDAGAAPAGPGLPKVTVDAWPGPHGPAAGGGSGRAGGQLGLVTCAGRCQAQGLRLVTRIPGPAGSHRWQARYAMRVLILIGTQGFWA